MKKSLLLIAAMLAVVSFARAYDEGGDGYYLRHSANYRSDRKAPTMKPTMAYYSKGYRIYYGYTPVTRRQYDFGAYALSAPYSPTNATREGNYLTIVYTKQPQLFHSTLPAIGEGPKR